MGEEDQMDMQQGAGPAPNQGQGGQPPQQGPDLSQPNAQALSPVVQQHMPQLEQMQQMLSGQLGDAYEQVVTAGFRMMYSDQSAGIIKQIVMDDKIPIANKLGEGVANLLVMMDNQGNGSIPKEIIVPVGITLLFEAADYLYEVGINVEDKDLGDAMEVMLTAVWTAYGIDPKQMDDKIDQLGKQLGFDSGSEQEEAGESPEIEAAEEGEGGEESPMGERMPEQPEDEEAFNQGFAGEQQRMGGGLQQR